MDEATAVFHGVRFGDGETGAGDRLCDTEACGEATSEGSFASTDVADEFDNLRTLFGELFTKV